ncbi:MAG: hypothetical protein LUF87_10305 [Alistipes sp.]|nr:hypothetical protein [Alistipes sp.]
MFTIQYELLGNLHFPEREVAGLDSTDLRQRLFLGSFILADPLHRIIPPYRNIPLLDFSLCLLDIDHNLREQRKRMDNYEFPLSDEMISFVLTGGSVDMEPTFDDVMITASQDEFSERVRLFNRTLIEHLIDLNPSLYRNKLFLTYTNLARLL